jgi:CBS domain-containing protein
MALANNATPLIALDAFVIDTETTGLDPAKVRIIEIGAVPLNDGGLNEKAALRRLVNPGEPIPETASRITRIDDAMVADAPGFAEAWPEFAVAMSGKVLIGHTLGFDLAVLKRECARAGLPWHHPRTLDTNLLAQVVSPNLGGFSLEHLASWLGIEVEGRHSALGDAELTGKIFLALIPKLREGRIRTLAEAEQACFALTSVLEDQHSAGWEEAVAAPSARREPSLARIDPYPYRHRIGDVMSAPPQTIAADALLGQALHHMEEAKVSSLLVPDRDAGTSLRPAGTGIVTERDVLRALVRHGAGALNHPVAEYANRPLVCVRAVEFLYRAIARMSRLKLRHLGVENETGEICGMVSARDLLRLRAQEVAVLGDGLDQGDDVPALAASWAQLPEAAGALLAEDISGRDVAAVVSRELDALTRRAGVLAERRMRQARQGGPPCAFALCVLGSGGRGESLLSADQDNAIVFAEGEPGGAADQWFAQFGSIVADILNEVGVPYCTGGVMAKNDQWRGSLATWRDRVGGWITHSKPENLLSVDIFFDLIGVYGDVELAQKLWQDGFDAAKGNAAFAKLLAQSAGDMPSGLNIFGGLRTEDGRIDLKLVGLFGIVSTARVLAIRHHLLERSTPARLGAVAALGRSQHDLGALARAQAVFLDLIAEQQVADIQAGLPPGNKVAVRRLTREQRKDLREALGAVRHLDTLTRDLLF